jgi:hypothetical protein
LLPLRLLPIGLLIASALYSGTLFSAQESPQSQKGIRILFLGDQGHHRPTDRFKQLEPALTTARIRYTYTESLDDLNPEKLATQKPERPWCNICRN